MRSAKSKRVEKIIAGAVFLGVLALAIAMPFLFPAFFAAMLASVFPLLSATSIYLAGAAFYTLVPLAGLVVGALAGGTVSIVKSIFSLFKPKSATTDNNVSDLYVPQSPAQLAELYNTTNTMQAPAQTADSYEVVIAQNPLQTNTGETEAYLRSTKGVYVGAGFYNETTKTYRPVQGINPAEQKREDKLEPFYVATNIQYPRT